MCGIRALCGVAVLAIGAHVVIVAAASQNPAAPIEVGPNVHVSAANADRHHLEVDLAADPRRPGGLLACSMIAPPLPSSQLFRTVTYYSGDDGRSWRPTLEIDTGVAANGDPTCAFGPDGTAYFVSVEGNHGGAGRRTVPLAESIRDYLLLYRSTDGGRNWLRPPQTLPGHDRPWVTVDLTRGTRSGTVYVSSNYAESRADGGRVRLLRTQSFRPDGVQLSNEAFAVSTVHLGGGAILSDGTYVIAFGESAGRPVRPARGALFESTPAVTHNLKVLISSDGGRSFSVAGIVAPFSDYQTQSTYGIVSLAADASEGPFRDRLYLAWAAVQSGRFQILLVRSDDRGRTWSPPAVVHDDAPSVPRGHGPDHFMPSVRVNHAGVVGMSWYDRRNSPDNVAYEVRFAASLDGGQTFLPSVRISEAGHSARHDVWSLQYSHSWGGGNPVPEQRTSPSLELAGIVDVLQVGHTAGLAAAPDDTFHALWVDNRTGRAQVWTAPITVRGAVVRHGSKDLANLTDVSQHVAVNFVDTELERSTGTVTITAHIVNTSQTVLAAPLKLRAISLRSDLGPLAAMNADNGAAGPGAIWDFSDVLEAGSLKPGARTRGRELVFRIDRPLTILDGRAVDYARAIAAFDVGVRIFAVTKKTLASRSIGALP